MDVDVHGKDVYIPSGTSVAHMWGRESVYEGGSRPYARRHSSMQIPHLIILPPVRRTLRIFSRHVPIYQLLPSQACFPMIRIIYTSFTFIDLLLFLVPKTFLESLCFPILPRPPLPFPRSHPEECNLRFHFPFTCVSSSPFPLPCESHCL